MADGGNVQATPKKKGGMFLLGCGGGGCGCSLLLVLVGMVLVAFGMERKTQEAMPFGILTLAAAFLAGLVGAGLLVAGILARKKKA